MSTKTLRKRIALVAVSALGAGLLSVVAVPSANASATDAAAVNANATTGVATFTASIGKLAESGGGTTQTAVLLATGTLSVTFTGVTGTATITGGKFTGTSGAANATISGTSGASATATAFTSVAMNLMAVPNAGATSMVIEYFADAVLAERVSVTVVATSVYNKYSGAYSYAYWGAGAGAGTDDATSDSTSTNSQKASCETLAGDIALVDSYGNLLTTSNLGMLTATVTAGAVVNLNSASTAGSTTIDYQTVTGSFIPFNVQQADCDAPWNGTITIAFDGVVVATKSGILKGEVASVTATSPKIGKKGSSNTSAATIAFADSAGNALYPTTGVSAVSSTLGGTVTALSVGTWPTSSVAGKITMTCGSGLQGAVKGLQVQHLNTSGTVVKSNTWDSACADVPYTVVASWDRVSYVPGSVATLTLLFKDSKGNLANAYDAIGANTAGDLLTVSGGPSAAAITPIAATNTPSGVTGAITYQYVVGTTEGDYVAVVNPTRIMENNTSVTTNISLPYSVKSSSTSVSNADVLKAIVSLIASINKQIAALQKALLKKK
jgi:hypothetical protein